MHCLCSVVYIPGCRSYIPSVNPPLTPVPSRPNRVPDLDVRRIRHKSPRRYPREDRIYCNWMKYVNVSHPRSEQTAPLLLLTPTFSCFRECLCLLFPPFSLSFQIYLISPSVSRLEASGMPVSSYIHQNLNADFGSESRYVYLPFIRSLPYSPRCPGPS
ncbi:hypothetical protein B0H11DRAFT_582947 [Mycena galericulata]|nr:hypothetical protein B0H11DRAFT_582947 [Mycena galericulata]